MFYAWNLLVSVTTWVFTSYEVDVPSLEAPSLRKILDEMEQQYNGADAKFSDYEYNRLIKCMGEDDDLLVRAQENAWKVGFIDVAKNGGIDKDSNGNPDKWGHRSSGQPFLEGQDPANERMFGDIRIYQPCNYVSNVAFYRSVTRICEYNWTIDKTYVRELKRAFANLAAGSAHMHGSHTSLGAIFDTRLIAIIFYLGHQISVQHLPGDSPILRQMSETPMADSSISVSGKITQLLADKGPNDWADFLTGKTSDYP